jgi:hypothetical protein
VAETKASPENGTETGSGENAEKLFWDEHEKRTAAVLDKWFESKKTELASSRNSAGKTTIPKFLADLLLPPAK